MADYPIVNGRSSDYPIIHYGAEFKGNTATFCEPSDLLDPSASVLAIPNQPVVVLKNGVVQVDSKFFGVNYKYRSSDSASGINIGTVRSHDLENGKGRWQFIEPSDNVWDFVDLDKFVNTNYALGRDILIILFGTPQWASARPNERNAYSDQSPEQIVYNRGIAAEPADMTKWDRFCTTVATRYLGKVKYYEVWNEPNQFNDGTGAIPETPFFFSGTFAKLAEMVRRAAQAIKAIDPTAKIISPATTTWSSISGKSAETYTAGMLVAPTGDGSTVMKDWVDIIGVHLYLANDNTTKDLAGIIDNVNAAKATAGVSGLDTWDTESAPIIPNANLCTEEQLKIFLTRFMITLAAKGVKRTMYYHMDDGFYGFFNKPSIISYWNSLNQLLISGSISVVARLFDGRIVYLTQDGQTIL